MEKINFIFTNGYYDDNGWWQRTKFCFVPCTMCTCKPPGNLHYNKLYDKTLNKPKGPPNIIINPWK